ncbi:MAG: two component regulator propeller domain protein [Bacteroidetes bacterium]|nr:two component regulator propeller domain protein [Bacteroidota bacterium]
MKKILLPLLLICLQLQAVSQSLTGWTHYYARPYYYFNTGNNITSGGPEELILMDKTTLAFTRVPFPDDIQQINLHNSGYMSGGMYYSCLPMAVPGPGTSTVVRGCGGNNYLFDGTSFNPFSAYLGYSSDSVTFLPFTGGSIFFNSTDNKLHKYDGSTHTVFDLSNSPYSSYVYYYLNTTPNDDIFMAGGYSIAIYHGGAWATYDTTFFHQHYVHTLGISTSLSNDYSFFSGLDSSIHTFVNASNSWTSAQIPASVIHSFYGYGINSTVYDNSGDLWIAGDSVLCRYDGTQFYDYFGAAAAAGANLSYLNLLQPLAGTTVLLSDNYHNYIVDGASVTAYRYDDPHAVLSGNQLLPSLKDRDGTLWFGDCSMMSENPLMKYDGTFSTIHTSDYFYGGVFTIKQDTGQAIVFGGGDNFSDGPMILSDTLNYLDPTFSYNKTVEELAIDQNHHYWYGGPGAGAVTGLAEFDGTTVNYHVNPSSSNNIYALDIDSLGNKWASYTSWDGVYVYNGSTWVHYTSATSALPNDTIDDITREPNTNNMWISTSGGFARFSNGSWTIFTTANSPIPSNDAEYVYFADDGSTWFATQNGFASLHGSTWEVYTVANSQLNNSDVESIVLDNECNVWIATENGLTVARNQCGSSQGINVSGNVYHPGAVAAANTLVYVYKLNSSRTDVSQVENIYTDNSGKFYYTAADTGTYFFDAVVNPAIYPGEITSYHDSSLVVQQSAPLHITADGNFSTNIWLKRTIAAAGSCSFNGKLVSSTERTGSVRVILMYAGKPVKSTLSNMDGTFSFSNIAAQNYTLWIDKYGFSNSAAPTAMVNCASTTVYPYTLYSNHLVSVNDLADAARTSFNLFPNPFNERFTISITAAGTKTAQLMITDISGKIILEKELRLQAGENEFSIDGSACAQGIYFVRLVAGDEVLTGKIVK